MKEFQEPTLELVTFEGDVITASDCPRDCRKVCNDNCKVQELCGFDCDEVG